MDLDKFVSAFQAAPVQATRMGTRYYLLPDDVAAVQKKIHRDLFSAGIPLGEQKKEFLPSLALLEIIARTSPRKAVVNQKAAWLFLCGRDILNEGVISCAVDDGLVLVQNERDENLGYGVLQKKGRQTIIKNLLDRGNFLRRER